MSNFAAAPNDPKALALAAAAELQPQATGLVDYRSEGKVLLIGEPVLVAAALRQLDESLQPHCLLTSDAPVPPSGVPYQVCEARNIELTGHLGHFEVRGKCKESGDSDKRYDLIVDLLPQPLLSMNLLPAGYFAPGTDQAALGTVLTELPNLVGRFEKPQYFNYDASICAHGASGLEACRRCLDTCPAQAITSIGEKIEVDPHLCQGGGVCATVCPTGAITYQYPPAVDTLDRIRCMLHTYLDAGGAAPILLLHGVDDAPETSDRHTLPCALEELASAGIETWLSALAYGASQVRLRRPRTAGKTVETALETQRSVANAILRGLGYPDAVHWDETADAGRITSLPGARFAGAGAKRQNLYLAVDHLVAHAPQPVDAAPLPEDAPLGQVLVDRSGCTLCLACASVCPAKALSDGGDKPALRFFEANCVQCGLCSKACPEQVISLEPRILYDAELRRQPRLLNEEEAFCCVQCGKPFATRSVIDKMTERLAGHWVYRDEAARRRLLMCEDCRVLDMMCDAG